MKASEGLAPNKDKAAMLKKQALRARQATLLLRGGLLCTEKTDAELKKEREMMEKLKPQTFERKTDWIQEKSEATKKFADGDAWLTEKNASRTSAS